MTTFHSKIEAYKNAGLTVFPCRGRNSFQPKSPIPEDWKNSNCQISEFTTEYVGMACNNGIEVLDFDNHLFNAKKIIKAFMNGCWFKDKFVVNRTAGGGYHLIYLTEEVEGNKKLAAQYCPLFDSWETIIETRGYGGQIIIPPSPNYRTLQGSLLDIKLISLEEREWLFNKARTFHEKRPREIRVSTFELKENETDLLKIFNDSPEGLEYMIATLKQYGWRVFNEDSFTRPNKGFGTSATLTKPHNRFKVWSSNCDPFEENRIYSASMVMNLLEDNGDWSKTFKKIKQIVNKY